MANRNREHIFLSSKCTYQREKVNVLSEIGRWFNLSGRCGHFAHLAVLRQAMPIPWPQPWGRHEALRPRAASQPCQADEKASWPCRAWALLMLARLLAQHCVAFRRAGPGQPSCCQPGSRPGTVRPSGEQTWAALPLPACFPRLHHPDSTERCCEEFLCLLCPSLQLWASHAQLPVTGNRN